MLEIMMLLIAAVLYAIPISFVIYWMIRWVQKLREPYKGQAFRALAKNAMERG